MNSTAILARTNRVLSLYEQALTEQNIPYHLVGKTGFFSQPEISFAMSFAQASLFPTDYALSSAIRSPFWVSKFLPRQKLCARLKEMQQGKEPSYWHLMTKEPYSLVDSKNLGAVQEFTQFVHGLSRYRALPPEECLKQLYSVLRVGDCYGEECEPDNSPLDNLQELLKISHRHRDVKGFVDFVRRASAASKKKSGVALSTIHSAKGMEYSSVYVVQCTEGILPHAKATDLDGERHCFYVACSRAEHKLTVTYSGVPSPFLESHLKSVQLMEKETTNA